MGKELSEMSLEELWELFPILLKEHRPCWRAWYEEEERRLRGFLPGESVLRISHVGSTAVPGIWAKPIIDILLEVRRGRGLEDVAASVQRAGYILMSSGKERFSFNRGYTAGGFADRVFHLHLRREGDNDELYFRDYLRDHPETAKEYERLKMDLWPRYEHDRDGYTAGKTDFVKLYTEKARRLYGAEERQQPSPSDVN